MKTRSALALSLGLALGLSGGVPTSTFAASLAPPAGSPAQMRLDGSFAKLAESVKPAVVNVNTDRKRTGRSAGGEVPGRSERAPRGLGSGVIIDPSGVALTNAHVVGGASEVDVTLLDGTKHRAKVVGVDQKTDLAVLRLDANGKKFPFLPLGDSTEVQVGDWVLAVGSPFGLQATVTSGIVSAKARQIGAGPYDDYLPDRRRHQPRQLRRPARQHARRGDRHQHRHRARRLRHRVRDPGHHGQADRQPAARERQGDARLARRRAAAVDAGPGGFVRRRGQEGRARQRRHRRQPGGQGRAEVR